MRRSSTLSAASAPSAGAAGSVRLVLAALLAAGILLGGCSSSDSGQAATSDGVDASTSSDATADASASANADTDAPSLRLVVLGDSIPYNDPADCPGCTGFVARYADALAKATGEKVETLNFSQHNGLTLPMLLDELGTFKDYVRDADAILLGIAHNTIVLNQDDPCGTSFDESTSTLKDWSKVTPTCAATSAAKYRPQYDRLYKTLASWREGRPTILLTLDKYNDWIGWKDAHLTPDQKRRTKVVHDLWNKMLCGSAERNGFVCVDVYHEFNGADGMTASGDLLAADYTHPSEEGNARIAKLLVAQGFDALR